MEYAKYGGKMRYLSVIERDGEILKVIDKKNKKEILTKEEI